MSKKPPILVLSALIVLIIIFLFDIFYDANRYLTFSIKNASGADISSIQIRSSSQKYHIEVSRLAKDETLTLPFVLDKNKFVDRYLIAIKRPNNQVDTAAVLLSQEEASAFKSVNIHIEDNNIDLTYTTTF